MANETETTPSNSVTEEQQRMPVFPARPDDSSGINGSDVPAQYKAIHEAQLLHEETFRQIREELRSYKQKLTELAETSGAQRPGHMGAVLMRLSELERKMGEGAPDPLLNEIVHRLASLESAGGGRGGNDPRVDGLVSQIENLRKQLADPQPSDPRTDDVVLRIAAVEGSLKRAQQDLSADRFEDLERQVAEDRSRVEEQLTQRLSAVVEETSRTSREAGEVAGERIAAIERRIEDSIGDGSFAALTARLNEIEEFIQQQPTAELPEAAVGQFQAFERRLAELSDAAVLEADLASFQEKLQELENQAADSSSSERLEERLAAIESRVQEPVADSRVDELASRISTVEEKTVGLADVEAAAIEDLLAKIKELEQQLPQSEQAQELATRLDALETRWDESQGDAPDLSPVIGRVEKLESYGAQAFESRLAELSGRLRAVEIKEEGSSADNQGVSRLAERLDQLELTGSSGDVARQLSELRERVAALAEQPQQSATDPQLEDKLQAALARLDALDEKSGQQEALSLIEQVTRRVDEIETNPATADPRVDAFEKQLVSLRAELGSLRSTAEQGIGVERLEALASQIEELRETTTAAPQGGTEEIAELREKIEALGSSASDSALDGVWREMAVRIEELERQAASGLGEGSDSSASVELGQRLDRVESRLDERADGGGSNDVVERIVQRLDMVEHNVAQGVGGSAGGLDDSLTAEIASRFEMIDQRLDAIGDSPGGANAHEALHQESERWSQWARSTLEEVGQLRRQVETLQQQGDAGESGGASPQLLATLSEKISSGLANSEVKAIQSHVNRLYFAVFLIIGMVLTFFMLNRS